MENFQLSLFLKIIGIGSASGILYDADHLFIISDNSTYLYQFHVPTQKLDKIALVENPQENIPKKDKPDFEAIARDKNKVFIIGSGSTQNRNKLLEYDLNSKKIKSKDFTTLYQLIKKQLEIADDVINIEGLIIDEKRIYLFQRGNGIGAKNGIIQLNDDQEAPNIEFFPIHLPTINQVATSFTDAILVDKKIYFLAAAEDVASTYEDGIVVGSILGVLDADTFKLEKYLIISNHQKFEGITLFQKNKNSLEFLLCEDDDTENLESTIYKLVLD
jgi:hypothetical protein